VYSNNIKLVEKFCTQVIEGCQEQGIYEQIQTLASKTNMTNTNHRELDVIDNDLTHILVKANQKCVKYGNSPWLPQLHEAYLVHHYWSLKLSQKRTGWNYPQAFQVIEDRIP